MHDAPLVVCTTPAHLIVCTPHPGQAYMQKSRTLRMSKKRLKELNGQITQLTQQILNLEAASDISTIYRLHTHHIAVTTARSRN